MRKNKHPLTSQRGFGRTTSRRPGLTAPVAEEHVEIPAFIISGTLGLLLARALWIEVNGNGDAAAEALGFGRTFLFVVIPLVAVAAVTEAFITPEIINLVA